jgi:RecB family exonuclease
VVDGTPELYATRLEDLARCPWQSFLRRELGLEPVPDALAALPAPDARLVGIVVHRALEEWVRAALGAAPAETLAEAWARGPTRVPAPDAHAAAELLAKAARVVSEQEGLRLPGFAEALAAHVRPMFDVALRIDGSDPGGIPVLGAELDGSLVVEDVEGRPRRIGFRADRADRLEGGVLRLTDYKTGKPVSEAKREQTRRRHFEAAVAEARRVLQAPAYWLGAHALAERARGRLLYLRDGLDDACREVEVDDADGAIVTAFESVARTVLAAWDAGTLFPRLVGPNGEEPQTCRWCDVSAACLRGESGHGLRLRDWAARSDAARDRSDAALLALQRLGEPDDDSGVRGGAPADAAEAGES